MSLSRNGQIWLIVAGFAVAALVARLFAASFQRKGAKYAAFAIVSTLLFGIATNWIADLVPPGRVVDVIAGVWKADPDPLPEENAEDKGDPIRLNAYNEGWYRGDLKDGKPDGEGVLTYGGFDDNKYYYSKIGSEKFKALRYTGHFSNGNRYGRGKVEYEGGYIDEGTFYGEWKSGKVVFEGKRWLIDGTQNGYWPITVTAKSGTKATAKFGPWHSADG